MALDWQNLDAGRSVRVPARPANGIWTVVRSYVGISQIIRIASSCRNDLSALA